MRVQTLIYVLLPVLLVVLAGLVEQAAGMDPTGFGSFFENLSNRLPNCLSNRFASSREDVTRTRRPNLDGAGPSSAVEQGTNDLVAHTDPLWSSLRARLPPELQESLSGWNEPQSQDKILQSLRGKQISLESLVNICTIHQRILNESRERLAPIMRDWHLSRQRNMKYFRSQYNREITEQRREAKKDVAEDKRHADNSFNQLRSVLSKTGQQEQFYHTSIFQRDSKLAPIKTEVKRALEMLEERSKMPSGLFTIYQEFHELLVQIGRAHTDLQKRSDALNKLEEWFPGGLDFSGSSHPAWVKFRTDFQLGLNELAIYYHFISAVVYEALVRPDGAIVEHPDGTKVLGSHM